MTTEPEEDTGAPEQTPREEGRTLACEGIVRARFGERPTAAGSRALERLRAEDGRRSRRALRARSVLGLPALAAAGLAAAGLVAAILLGKFERAQDAGAGSVPRLAQLSGSPLVCAPGGREIPAVLGQALPPGTEVRTGRADAVVMAYEDGSSIRLAGTGRVGIARRGGAKRLVAYSGEISAEIAPQPPGDPMTLATPDGEIVVRGTRFLLIVEELGTRLEVLEGLVELSGAGKSLLVGGGRAATIRRGEAPTFEERLAAAPQEVPMQVPAPPESERAPREPEPQERSRRRRFEDESVFSGEIAWVDAASARFRARLHRAFEEDREGEGEERTFALSPRAIVILRGPVLDELRPGDRVVLRASTDGEAHVLVVSRPGVSPPPERWERPEEFIRRHERREREPDRGGGPARVGRPEPDL